MNTPQTIWHIYQDIPISVIIYDTLGKESVYLVEENPERLIFFSILIFTKINTTTNTFDSAPIALLWIAGGNEKETPTT